jgi:hypothetical protein
MPTGSEGAGAGSAFARPVSRFYPAPCVDPVPHRLDGEPALVAMIAAARRGHGDDGEREDDGLGDGETAQPVPELEAWGRVDSPKRRRCEHEHEHEPTANEAHPCPPTVASSTTPNTLWNAHETIDSSLDSVTTLAPPPGPPSVPSRAVDAQRRAAASAMSRLGPTRPAPAAVEEISGVLSSSHSLHSKAQGPKVG